MDIFAAIATRRSALQIGEPGPTLEHLEKILMAGMNSPDHGKLSPCRYFVIEGEAREILGRAMAEARHRESPNASAADLDSARLKAFRAPTIIAAAAKIVKGGKIPEIEQVVSVGTGVENMFLVAHALGYGVMWKTGAPAYDPQLKEKLGLGPDDHIVAFLYIGTLVKLGPSRERTLEKFVQRL